MTIQDQSESTERRDEAKAFLASVLDASRDAAFDELTAASSTLLTLVRAHEAADHDTSILDESERTEILDLLAGAMHTVREAADDAPGAVDELQQVVGDVEQRWGGLLAAVADADDDARDLGAADDAFSEWTDDTSVEESPEEEPTGEVDLDGILDALRQTAATYSETGVVEQSGPQPAPVATPSRTKGSRILDDPAMVEAYLDDAVRCVASMEQSLLAYEADTNNRAALNQVCRELHTLKGASASVELTELAAFLHDVEDSVRAGCDPSSPPPDPSDILLSIDKVRSQIEAIGGSTNDTAAAPDAPTSTAAASYDAPSSSSEPTLRVRAAQVDRLMDMLAELVMLRNRRDSRVEGIKGVQNELFGCASRVRGFDNGYYGSHGGRRGRRDQPRAGTRSNSFSEVADDIFAATEQLRGVSEPLDAENLAISQFIRQFRQELVEIRRVPAEGLFRRLQRAVRDAAKVEQKQVQLQFVGEQTGIDRTLQESLYDPLLHIVRNAVSHGIESPQDRVVAGKPADGSVILEARGGANFLVIEVRDDGRGLDYDALRRKGLQQNLLKSDQPATHAELAQLIFHPGFSTQSKASEISGRGVGMDVVASTIERLRGWIEIESTTGQGCCIRITTPLQSTIEHAMLFRDGGQTFAIPMRFVHTVSTGEESENGLFDSDAKKATPVAFGRLFEQGSSRDERPGQATLVVGFEGADVEAKNNRGGLSRVALKVDEIVGPEEVVMRPLPGLLRDQRLYTGVSLAGSGDIVLALDTQQLLERCAHNPSPTSATTDVAAPVEEPAAVDPQPKALVVDDSVTARRTMAIMLQRRGFTVAEAIDGAEGLQALKADDFQLLVSDLEMPRMDGLQLLEAIQDDSSLESLTAILNSSRDEEEFQTRAKELGAVAYLVKPVAEEQLDDVLNRHSFGQRVD